MQSMAKNWRDGRWGVLIDRVCRIRSLIDPEEIFLIEYDCVTQLRKMLVDFKDNKVDADGDTKEISKRKALIKQKIENCIQSINDIPVRGDIEILLISLYEIKAEIEHEAFIKQESKTFLVTVIEQAEACVREYVDKETPAVIPETNSKQTENHTLRRKDKGDKYTMPYSKKGVDEQT